MTLDSSNEQLNNWSFFQEKELTYSIMLNWVFNNRQRNYIVHEEELSTKALLLDEKEDDINSLEHDPRKCPLIWSYPIYQ